MPLQPVRRFTNAQRLRRVKNFCRTNACDPNERDPLFSITPLHLAAITGDAPLEQWLLERGAVPTFDHANRKPQNLSFSAFISNSKAWKAQGEDCDFPIVDFSRDASHARKEVRRLVTEGEPVLMRAAYPAYENSTSAWEVHQWVTQFAHHKVTVGRVPYANAFNLATEVMTLQQYFNTFNASSNSDPSYVFNKDTAICQPGYDTLSRLVEEAFPIDKLLVHPNDTGGLDGIHFFFGSKHSGAPFHVHSDAINAAIKGRKKWFVYTPQRTIYSRRTIKRWLEEDYATMPDEEKPLECVQHPGDVVYVPLDWGHAVLNLDDHAFGFALELLNRRDTLSHIWR